MHTKEPWKVVIDDDYSSIEIMKHDSDLSIAEMWRRGNREQEISNANRIVACVNACAGIPDDVLAGALHHGVDPLQKRIAGLELQRDKLFNALEGILDCISETRGKYVYDKVKLGRNLISEIKAGQ